MFRFRVCRVRPTGGVDTEPDPERRQIAMLFTAQSVVIFAAFFWNAGTKLLDVGGSRAFQGGDLKGSIAWFDASASAGIPRWLLWKRGIALYYAGRYAEAAAQFREDLIEKPKVMEESVWLSLCEAQQGDFQGARQRMRDFDGQNGVLEDTGPGVRRSIYTLFLGGGDEHTANMVLQETARAQGSSESFYAALYLGLFAEAQNDVDNAKRWTCYAVCCDYAQTSTDFMVSVAQLHARLRGWPCNVH